MIDLPVWPIYAGFAVCHGVACAGWAYEMRARRREQLRHNQALSQLTVRALQAEREAAAYGRIIETDVGPMLEALDAKRPNGSRWE